VLVTCACACMHVVNAQTEMFVGVWGCGGALWAAALMLHVSCAVLRVCVCVCITQRLTKAEHGANPKIRYTEALAVQFVGKSLVSMFIRARINGRAHALNIRRCVRVTRVYVRANALTY
jgi:hypothetical protein